MPKRPLTKPALSRESDLQALIDNWPDHRGWRLAGAPGWLRDLPQPSRRRRIRTALNYSFEPDALFETDDSLYVAELKFAASGKHEAVALPEVLHHAWMLENDAECRKIANPKSKKVVPVILARWNGWLVASLAAIGSNRPIYLLLDAYIDGKSKILWTGSLFEPWALVPTSYVPPQLLSAFPTYSYWYRVESEDAFFGCAHPQPDRPPITLTPHVEAARIESSEEFVACEGSWNAKWNYWIVT